MNRRRFLQNLALLAGGAALGYHANPLFTRGGSTQRRPNIILVFTDDQGYADLGVQNILSDVRTPHLDRLARNGVLFSDGYITAPQCTPSRAGLLTGKYQQRFGLDDSTLGPMPLDQPTFPQLLQKAGYTTGMVGKWHLQPSPIQEGWIQRYEDQVVHIPGVEFTVPDGIMLPYLPEQRGFDEYLYTWHPAHQRARLNFHPTDAKVNRNGEWRMLGARAGFRADLHNAWALEFIRRRQPGEPFFLYLAHSVPHVPLDAPREYLERFPGEMPERRRQALGMMAAVDDGVGAMVMLLKERGEFADTLFLFASDNGAPLDRTMRDLPIDISGPTWDGSRNDPLRGEKGMLTEAGIRVPFLMSWPGVLPACQVYREPVISLDLSATILSAAGVGVPEPYDGVDLLPYVSGENEDAPHDALYWRFWQQAAVRAGDWKYLRVGDKLEYLFNVREDKEESLNLLDAHPEKAQQLRLKLEQWAKEMEPPGIPEGDLRGGERVLYPHFMKDI